MIVADTSPLNYLVQIAAIDLLPALYGTVVVPVSVAEELADPGAPAAVRTWIAGIPESFILARPLHQLSCSVRLDKGELEAISLAIESRIPRILIDEAKGRRECGRRGLQIIGTLSILVTAGRRGLMDPLDAYRRLRSTTFRVSSSVEADFLDRIRHRRPNP